MNKLGLKDGGNIFIYSYGAMLLMQVAVSVYAIVKAVYAGQTDAAEISLNTMLIVILNQVIYMFVPYLYGRSRRIYMSAETGLFGRAGIKEYLLTAAISPLCIMAFLPLALVFVYLFSLLGYSGSDIGVDGGFLTLTITLCVLPALGEETLFRGSLAGSLRHKGYGYAIIMSALIFSLAHGSPSQTVHQFCLGAVLAYIFFVTNDVKPAMLLHFLNNFISIILDSVNVPFLNMEITPLYILVSLCVSLVAGIILGAALKLLKAQSLKRAGSKTAGGSYLADSIKDFCNMFRKGGLKAQIERLNAEINIIRPGEQIDFCPVDENGQKIKTPANIIFAIVLLLLMYIGNTVLSM